MSQTKSLIAVVIGFLFLTYFLVGSEEDGGVLSNISALSAENSESEEEGGAEARRADEARAEDEARRASAEAEEVDEFVGDPGSGWGDAPELPKGLEPAAAAATPASPNSGQFGSVDDIGDYSASPPPQIPGLGSPPAFRPGAPRPSNRDGATNAADNLAEEMSRALGPGTL